MVKWPLSRQNVLALALERILLRLPEFLKLPHYTLYYPLYKVYYLNIILILVRAMYYRLAEYNMGIK